MKSWTVLPRVLVWAAGGGSRGMVRPLKSGPLPSMGGRSRARRNGPTCGIGRARPRSHTSVKAPLSGRHSSNITCPPPGRDTARSFGRCRQHTRDSAGLAAGAFVLGGGLALSLAACLPGEIPNQGTMEGPSGGQPRPAWGRVCCLACPLPLSQPQLPRTKQTPRLVAQPGGLGLSSCDRATRGLAARPGVTYSVLRLSSSRAALPARPE